MRIVAAAVLAAMALAPFAGAQKLELKFENLAAKSSEKAEVDVDGALLKLLPHFISKKDAEGKAAVDLLSGVQEIHVRNYEFANSGAYSDRDLEPLRRQVEGSGWSRIMQVKEKEESVEVFVQMTAGKITSCLVLAAEARELSVVYVMGTLTLAQAKHLADSDVMSELAELK